MLNALIHLNAVRTERLPEVVLVGCSHVLRVERSIKHTNKTMRHIARAAILNNNQEQGWKLSSTTTLRGERREIRLSS